MPQPVAFHKSLPCPWAALPLPSWHAHLALQLQPAGWGRGWARPAAFSSGQKPAPQALGRPTWGAGWCPGSSAFYVALFKQGTLHAWSGEQYRLWHVLRAAGRRIIIIQAAKVPGHLAAVLLPVWLRPTGHRLSSAPRATSAAGTSRLPACGSLPLKCRGGPAWCS